MYSDFLDQARNYINAEALNSKKPGAMKSSRGNPEGDRQKDKKRLVETPVRGSQQPHEDKRHRDLGVGYEAARACKQRYGR